VHILLVADGRSPTTLSYLQSLYALGLRVSMISTFPCAEPQGLAHFEVIPAALARFAGSQAGTKAQQAGGRSILRKAASSLRRWLQPIRYTAGPLGLPRHQKTFLRVQRRTQPDLVHALRIPYEGMLASCTPPEVPLAVSVWGNDLTLHAGGSPWMRSWTRKTLHRINGLAADTQRDIRLAGEWGYSPEKPTLVVPGAGGLDLPALEQAAQLTHSLPQKLLNAPYRVVNPRGFRPGSVRNDTFFASIPLVLQRLPDAMFACCAMQGQPEALEWVERLNIREHVILMPYLPQQETWALFHAAQVSASISQHDGTPNSLLEAMACGCLPVAGDIESLREWISPGQNGLLVDPSDPQELADALVHALTHADLRQNAAVLNRRIIETRAVRPVVQGKILSFYKTLLQS